LAIWGSIFNQFIIILIHLIALLLTALLGALLVLLCVDNGVTMDKFDIETAAMAPALSASTTRDAKQLKPSSVSSNTSSKNTASAELPASKNTQTSSDRSDDYLTQHDLSVSADNNKAASRSSLNDKLLNLEQIAAANEYNASPLPYYFYGPKLRRANANEVVADVPTALVPTAPVPDLRVLNPALFPAGAFSPGFYNG
jgi:hypothetical protein